MVITAGVWPWAPLGCSSAVGVGSSILFFGQEMNDCNTPLSLQAYWKWHREYQQLPSFEPVADLATASPRAPVASLGAHWGHGSTRLMGWGTTQTTDDGGCVGTAGPSGPLGGSKST